MNLRPYQQKGIEDIYTSWAKGYRSVMYVQPTGSGKSVCFTAIIKDFIKQGKRVMLIAHREELISQAWNHLYKQKIYSGIIQGKVQTNFDLPCQVASIQTLARRRKLPDCDLIIVDEAHHVQDDNTYGTVINERYAASNVLGVTATPYRLSGVGFNSMFDKLVVSVGFNDLVNQGYLSPVKYLIGSVPDLTGTRMSAGDYRDDDSEKAMELAPLVESYQEHCDGMSGAVFAVNIHHSQTVVQKYQEAGIKSAHLDGGTNENTRRAILKDFKKGIIKIVSNVGILTEGFDFPGMQFVQLARPTKSLSMYLQMVGRVTRIMEGKDYGLILDNAGCYSDHLEAFRMITGDSEIDWNVYFNGWKDKRKQDKDLEKIELIEFVAEDEEGRRFVTKQPEEIAGMRLIEVNSSIKERVINITSLKKFDELFAMFHRMPKVKKVGFVAYFGYRDYCEKNRILMNDSVWEYLFKRLVKDRREKVKDHQKYFETVKSNILQAPEKYPDSQELIKGAEKNMKKQIEKCNMYGVPESFLKKEMKEYKIKLEKEMNMI